MILDLVDEIRKALNTINQIQTRSALTAAEVDFLQARIAEILKSYVPPEERRQALDELRQITDTTDGQGL